jgi:hypothetical protein
MKTKKMTVWQWISSLFVKPKKQVQTLKAKSEVVIDPYFDTIKKIETYTVNEMPEKIFDNKTKVEIMVDGKAYHLTEKQRVFYTAVVENQKKFTEGVLGWKIVYEFLKYKHGFDDSQMGNFSKSKFRISEHYKTMTYLYSSGLVKKVGKKFIAKV